MADPLSDPAPVDFQLGLAGSAGANAAAEPRKVRPLARQARQEIFQLRQLDLQFSFIAARPLGKNIQNQLTAVDDPNFKCGFQVALLGRGEILIDDRLDPAEDHLARS